MDPLAKLALTKDASFDDKLAWARECLQSKVWEGSRTLLERADKVRAYFEAYIAWLESLTPAQRKAFAPAADDTPTQAPRRRWGVMLPETVRALALVRKGKTQAEAARLTGCNINTLCAAVGRRRLKDKLT